MKLSVHIEHVCEFAFVLEMDLLSFITSFNVRPMHPVDGLQCSSKHQLQTLFHLLTMVKSFCRINVAECVVSQLITTTFTPLNAVALSAFCTCTKVKILSNVSAKLCQAFTNFFGYVKQFNLD